MEVRNMDGLTFAVATPEQVRRDLAENPADFWVGIPLDLPTPRAACSAFRLWGMPHPSPADPLLWRLRWRAGKGRRSGPVYLSLVTGEPEALFSGSHLPDAELGDNIAAALADLLLNEAENGET
jgi:hypothetical protein